MRPIKLTIKGLNSFIEEQEIDFNTLTQYGLFGVFGPTGSGKSTLLDGITIALYGKTSRDSQNYINTQCEQMYVEFEFKIKASIYKVTRTFKRNKQGSINASKPTRLVELVKGEERILEEQTTFVNQKCQDIIGLKFEDFIRTVVLPQGKFSDFIKLKGKERREMLERLFSLNRYGDDLTYKLQSAMKKERDKMFVLTGELKGFEEVTEASLTEKEERLKILDQEIVTFKLAYDLQKTKVEASKKQLDQLNKYKILTSEKESLLKNGERIKDLKIIIKDSKIILPIMPHYTLHEQLAKQLDDYIKELIALEKLVVHSTEESEKLKQLILKDEFAYNKLLLSHQKDYLRLADGKILSLETESLKKQLNALADDLDKVTTNKETYQKSLEVLKEKEGIASIEKESHQESMMTNTITNNRRKQILTGYELDKKLRLLTSQQDDMSLKVMTSNEKKTIEEERINTLSNKIKENENHLLTYKTNDMISEEIFLSRQKELINKQASSKVLGEQTLEFEKKIKQLERQKKDVSVVYKTLLNEKKLYDQAIKNNWIVTLQEDLEDGQACPVCGSHEHSPNLIDQKNVEFDLELYEETKTSLAVIEDQLSHNQSKLKQLAPLHLEDYDKLLSIAKEQYDTYKRSERLKQDIKQDSEKLDLFRKQCSETTSLYDETVQMLSQITDTIMQTESLLNNLKDETQIDDFEEEMLLQERKDHLKEKSSEQLKRLEEELGLIRQKILNQEKLKSDLMSLFSQKTLNKQHLLEQKNAKEETLKLWFGNNRAFDDLESEMKDKEEKMLQDLEINKSKDSILSEALKKDEFRIHELKSLIKETTLRKTQAFESYSVLLKQHNLELETLKSFLYKADEITLYEEQVRRFEAELLAVNTRLHDLNQLMDYDGITEETLKLQLSDLEEKESQLKHHETRRIELNQTIALLKVQMNELADLVKEQAILEHKISLLLDLDKLFKGKKFVEFVATYQLRYVAIEASKRLGEITSGKYGLEVDETGQFMVRDFSYGGVLRDTSTLSGGETFLVSLALALSLSSQIQLKGTAPLELFFLDEGFGTLDENFLEIVMSSLEKIHHKYLSIGLISHVEAIKNRVPIKLNVTPSESGSHGSRVKVEYS